MPSKKKTPSKVKAKVVVGPSLGRRFWDAFVLMGWIIFAALILVAAVVICSGFVPGIPLLPAWIATIIITNSLNLSEQISSSAVKEYQKKHNSKLLSKLSKLAPGAVELAGQGVKVAVRQHPEFQPILPNIELLNKAIKKDINKKTPFPNAQYVPENRSNLKNSAKNVSDMETADLLKELARSVEWLENKQRENDGKNTSPSRMEYNKNLQTSDKENFDYIKILCSEITKSADIDPKIQKSLSELSTGVLGLIAILELERSGKSKADPNLEKSDRKQKVAPEDGFRKYFVDDTETHRAKKPKDRGDQQQSKSGGRVRERSPSSKYQY